MTESTKKEDPKTKNAPPKPDFLSPEFIEKAKKIREERKEKKRLQANEKKNNIDPRLQFIKRPMLDIPGQTSDGGVEITIMSYNILAQALIRRKLFPTSGNALKWSNRSQVLLSEFKYYDSDILCLQEVDFIQYNSFWKLEFKNLGYLSQYYRADSKNHGVAIFFKSEKFAFQHSSFINYDKEKTGNVRPTAITRNVGMLVYLQFSEKLRKQYPNLTREGIIVGTTHLFWHPYGTAERTRQTCVVLQQMKEFTRILNVLYGAEKRFYRFFAGDFNSQPYDSPYLSITAKPTTYTDRAKNVIGRSLAHQWDESKEVKEDEGPEDEDKDKDKEDEQEVKDGTTKEIEGEADEDRKEADIDVEDSPVPKTFKFSPEVLQKIQAMEDLHNNLDMRAISLYSVGYHLVHKENAGLDNERNEPFFSNWAHAWRGLLDYIFVVSDWDKQESFANKVDSLEQLERDNHVKLLSLLRLPTPNEMGPEPSGQPRTGQYPSDHLCIIAKIELC
ncbi:CIC11C00000005777 [Sungouiella intermedia]|uniref:CIC11C00000005777 n=1 Tax=Sungouiella intermedia TaxID=45354 RepID=A0A1L0BE03_9ASCO|nr:CIC11C00000005777 [[Candida] intermedia]